MSDCRTYPPQAVTPLTQLVQRMSTNGTPFAVNLPPLGELGTTSLPVKVNAAELLNGMGTPFLKHRAGQSRSDICLLKGLIIPPLPHS